MTAKASTKAIPVGLVGAGPWAKRFHAPLLSTGVETKLTSVWSRRAEAAAALAAQHEIPAVRSFEALFDQCEAVAFAVAPDVQAELAPLAARANKALLLEKPIALELKSGERLADVVCSCGVPNMLMLTNRFSERNRRFITAAAGIEAVGGIGTMLSGSSLPGREFATPWRTKIGALLDVGPHMLDLLDAALGPIESISAQGDGARWITLTTRHQSQAIASASLSLTVEVPDQILRCEIFGRKGSARINEHFDHDPNGETAKNIRSEFVAAVRGDISHELDVRRGLYLQRWIDAAARSIRHSSAMTTAFPL